MTFEKSPGYRIVQQWLDGKGLKPFRFQTQAWQAISAGESGLVNAPTGSGKTYSVFLGALIQYINAHPKDYGKRTKGGLQLLWITPLRALAKDIGRAMEEVLRELEIPWVVGIRNGDTSLADRAKQKRSVPEILIITPESLHLLLAQKGYPALFKSLKVLAADEWHELMGSKRGVQIELALSRILSLSGVATSVWGISATIGNLEQAMEVLLSPASRGGTTENGTIIRADIKKAIEIESVIPEEIEKYPWAGHLGLRLAERVLPILAASKTTLIFINTRGMAEQWYQTLLNIAPELSGAIALHHGSIERELRNWVEDALHTGALKAVVCTASLDLGVDFRPVDTVIQVGSPKGVARFLQRAGRSGHQPDAVSKIYFLPTHTLELVEAAALKSAVESGVIESRDPLMLCYDVLIQYLGTLAISEGFLPEPTLAEVRTTHCFRDISDDDWRGILHFLTAGGTALSQYDEYKKVEVEPDGMYRIKGRRIAMRHRMHIGTIVSDPMLKVKFMSGGYIGVVEEAFIARLEPGDTFTLGGRTLELVTIKEMTVMVKKSSAKKAKVPSWLGGRLPLSQSLGRILRATLDEAAESVTDGVVSAHPEIQALFPLFALQQKLSHIPIRDELLIEHIQTADGYHLFVYPFEGRLVHEAVAALLAYRIAKLLPITFTFVMNDYGFELLSDQPIPVTNDNVYALFSPEGLLEDIQRSVNSTEMAKRRFRDIAVIGGLIFQGYPGERKKQRHLQASAGLLFNVFAEYDPQNVLLRQAYSEVFDQQMEEVRLRDMLQRIQRSRIVITHPERFTPFSFPIKVDSMREQLTSEKLADRVRRMQEGLNKA